MNYKKVVVIVFLFINTFILQANPYQFNVGFGGTGYVGMGGSVWSAPVVTSAIIQTDEKIVVAGYAQATPSSLQQIAVARFLTNGNLDTDFASTGYTLLPLESSIQSTTRALGQAVALDAAGNIVIVGYAKNSTANNPNLIIARFTSAGVPDSTFGIQGTTGITSNPMPTTPNVTGYIGTVNGTTNGSGGSLGYLTFLLNNQITGLGVAIQPDGKIVIVGQTNTNTMIALRFLSTGALDTVANGGSGFGPGGVGYVIGVDIITGASQTFRMNAVSVLNTGAILIAGLSATTNGQMMLIRLTSAGLLDTTFNASGTSPSAPGYAVVVVASQELSEAEVLLVQPNGGIDIAGYTRNTDGKFTALSARYSQDGILDTTYGSPNGYVITSIPNNTTIEISGIVYDPKGKLLLTGYMSSSSGTYSIIIRYNLDGSLDTTFSSTGYIIVNADGIPQNSARSIALRSDGTLILGTNISGLGMGAMSFLGGGIPVSNTSTVGAYGSNISVYQEFLYINAYATIITDPVAQAATIAAVQDILTTYQTTYAAQANFNFLAYLYLTEPEMAQAKTTLMTAYPGSAAKIDLFFVYLLERFLKIVNQEI